MKHLIDPTDLSKEEIDQIIALAQDIIAHRERYQGSMAHKKLATLFYEPSTRTRLSFTAAMMELGGQVLGFSNPQNSSVSKGETVQDTVRVVGCFADIIAMRHPIEGAPLVASEVSRVPIINAGDGSHSHPTQTLTDLLTIKRELGRIDDITIGFCGDLRFGRTVHSLIKALSRYHGIKVVLIAPDELRLPDYIKLDVCEKMGVEYRETDSLDEAIPELDVLYMTRVQKERFLDEDEFDRVKDSFVLDARRMALAKPKMAVLHPLPRVNEILTEVDDDPRAAYFRQVENGKLVRMALIISLMEWKNDPEHTMPEHEAPIINPAYQYAIGSERIFRRGLIGPALVDVKKTLEEGRAYRGVDLGDPENRFVYYSPMSWSPSGTKAMWNERTRMTDPGMKARLRVARLLDYVPAESVPAVPTPDVVPFRVCGKESGFVVSEEGEDGWKTVRYEHFSDDGRTFRDGEIASKSPRSMYDAGENIFRADLTVTGEHEGRAEFTLTFTQKSLRDPVMLSFAPDEDGLPATRGYSEYDGVRVRAEDMYE